MGEFGELDRSGDPEFMASLARGLAVMRCVAEAQRPVTIADVARRTQLSRASVRRCLYTLAMLGYVGQDEHGYAVRRKALVLGHPYLSLNALAARAQPLLDALRDELGESCSLGIMEEDQLYYVARGEAMRIMSVGLRVGSRLPLYCTSMGRVLLSGRSDEEQEAYLARTDIKALTPRTVTDRARLLILFRSVGREGYALVDEELEMGLRSIAVPVTDRGKVVAALNIGTSAQRISVEEMRQRFLPALQATAERLRL
ncbi:IclR family transcriptional regulator C-terminal domain-containing protein (plasmid) [Sphingobium sp. SJ10-10]|uniref:IclR family transcriptional regulator domain-containing protein n=1 Tax=unclassified Sphingobium TaxID=2611147 RepID=UPI0007702504|nr:MULTISPECIES: IclR family transcriptional regulator C-terminal domain-containing protein [Sphingomonadaceae]AMK25239.1 transcriptional regulator, IclR family protein [Sphingobium sp. TKS]MEC6700709.1 IclR family transcriptional regulator C-terminal domain-containing protein [Sphingobium sp. SJ10-10]NML87897.1 helix-turn-helix domain-containing protein [Sphingobium sp. TB-6]